MAWEWTRGALADGLGCYRRGEYFNAHEHWELEWLKLAGPEKTFLQALIQLTAAMHHRDRGNTAGMKSLLTRSLRRLEAYPASFAGIDIARLREEVAEWLRDREDGNGPRQAGEPAIHPCAG